MPPGRPKAFDSTEALRAALQVFWAKGFAATSIGDLTDATGLGRQSLYNEFGDKQKLFAAAIQNYRQCETATMASILRKEASTAERIREFFRVALDAHFDGHRRGCFLTSSIAIRSEIEPELAQLMDEAVNDLRRAFVKCIQDGIDSGEVSANMDPEALGMLFFTQAQGISVVGKCQRDRATLDRSIEALLATLK
ncbi:MAG: TetR/AcrR family transcriptional regulator [Verrucomicrobiales bacterium]|nr:TetR/AcrR family transcriptional regulator [Verrucomicrobiales bacterium]